MTVADEDLDRGELRERILDAATDLIASGGTDAATTRAVSAAASVQAPTIYRFFGDKRGLLEAVAERAMAKYVAGKAARKPHADPIQDLRRGWDEHVAFGLAHPGVFAILVGEPRPGTATQATRAGTEVLVRRIKRIAAAGRLRVSEDRALALIHSMGIGVVHTLLRQPEAQRDRGLSELARESMIASITGESTTPTATGIRGAALALRASLDETRVLSPGERHLLSELLARIAESSE
jgi:AcrR family transcriptional regulator